MAAFPDLFAASVAGRQQAQREFADRLANLYAGGNMAAGQQLAGMDANRADQLRMALENMPASEQGKVAQRAQTLKKWLLTIQNDPYETAKPLLWNQMLGQLAGSGYDISTLPQSYSGASLAQAMNGVMTYEEMASALKERRLAETSGGSGTENERKITMLASGDPSDPVWRQNYINTFLVPKATYNPVTGRSDFTYIPADPVISQKAMSVGLGLNEPTKQVMQGMGYPTDMTAPGQPQQPKAAPGEITTAGADINGTQVQPKPSAPVVPKVVVQGPEPGISRAERERMDAEKREQQRKLDEEARGRAQKAQEANLYFDQLTRRIDDFIRAIRASDFGQRMGFSTSKDAGQLAAKQGILLGEFKGDKMFQLGVLNAGDKPFIQSIITDIGGDQAGFSLDRAFLERAVGKLEAARQFIKDKQSLSNASAKAAPPVGQSQASGNTAPAIDIKKKKAGF